MERTNLLPDAIYCGKGKEFTQIPNELIRNPNISAKAKSLICLLLSNKEGWKTHIITIKKMMLEGEVAIRAGLVELEAHGYLIRLYYRDRITKVRRGTVWAYTDTPTYFNFTRYLGLIDDLGCEICEYSVDNLRYENLHVEKLNVENQVLKTLNIKRLKKDTSFFSKNDKITINDFDKFWELYPSKRRGSKGDALTGWIKLCNPGNKFTPDWQRVRAALIKQKKSERWIQTPEYIPLASSWINKKKWLDDPTELKVFKFNDDRNTEPEIPKHTGYTPKWKHLEEQENEENEG